MKQIIGLINYDKPDSIITVFAVQFDMKTTNRIMTTYMLRLSEYLRQRSASLVKKKTYAQRFFAYLQQCSASLVKEKTYAQRLFAYLR